MIAILRVSSFSDPANVGIVGSCDRIQAGSPSSSPSSSKCTGVAAVPRTDSPCLSY